MKSIDIKIDTQPECPADATEMRALISSLLCASIDSGDKLPKRIRIKTTPSRILRDTGENYAEISLIPDRPEDHIILISYFEATKDQVLYRLLHELSHLLRAVNGRIDSDNEQEEIQNKIYLDRNAGLVGLIATALIQNRISPIDFTGDGEYEVESNARVGAVVC